MQHEWIIRVLEDMQGYARMHGLAALAEHLDQARLLALTEIASLAPSPPDDISTDPGGGPRTEPDKE